MSTEGGDGGDPPQAPISYLVTNELFETLMYCDTPHPHPQAHNPTEMYGSDNLEFFGSIWKEMYPTLEEGIVPRLRHAKRWLISSNSKTRTSPEWARLALLRASTLAGFVCAGAGLMEGEEEEEDRFYLAWFVLGSTSMAYLVCQVGAKSYCTNFALFISEPKLSFV